MKVEYLNSNHLDQLYLDSLNCFTRNIFEMDLSLSSAEGGSLEDSKNSWVGAWQISNVPTFCAGKIGNNGFPSHL